MRNLLKEKLRGRTHHRKSHPASSEDMHGTYLLPQKAPYWNNKLLHLKINIYNGKQPHGQTGAAFRFYYIGGPGAGAVCVRRPAKPMNSVFVRKPRGLKFRKSGPGAGAVCVRLPAKPMNSVFVRKPRGLKFRKGGPDAGAVCVRLPAKPMNSVFVRNPPGLKFRKGGPGAGLIRGISTLHL